MPPCLAEDVTEHFAGARLDEDGDVWFLGRVDDAINVSGHGLSTTEIESALVGNEAVAKRARPCGACCATPPS
ncbi:MAG: hypothetical protein ABS62_04010 [Microbacterium sp. SCN 70-200]|nr:MAG: hypothetical protein ABS62_04010 [Microbacterium sp. SCN 70-200]OJV79126.1 MAG: hypothetical protein BGO46_02330 [Microbacterium sp. 70-16]